MKLNCLFHFVSFLIAFSWTSHAMEDPNKDQNPLEGLQRIVKCAFPLPVYHIFGDLNSDTNHMFQDAQSSKQADSIIVMLPNEAIINILHCMDTQTLIIGLGKTCHFFYTVTQVSALYLNNYCLQEAMPHAIPPDILVRKTKNAKDGVFKLANLYSISEHDLLTWFGQPYLEDILTEKEALPVTLEGQTEEQLEALYPVLKITMAATPPGTGDPERLAAIGRLFNGQLPLNYMNSFNTVRLLSLCRDVSRGHNELLSLLCFHLLPQTRRQERLPNSNYQAIDIVARDLLMAGHSVPTVNNCYFMTNPQKKDIATQIIQWCCDHQWNFGNSHLLIRNARDLNEPELAFQILLKLIKLPNTQHPTPRECDRRQN